MAANMRGAWGMKDIEICVFDAYGTLFDVYSVGVLAERLFPGFGERLGIV